EIEGDEMPGQEAEAERVDAVADEEVCVGAAVPCALVQQGLAGRFPVDLFGFNAKCVSLQFMVKEVSGEVAVMGISGIDHEVGVGRPEKGAAINPRNVVPQ